MRNDREPLERLLGGLLPPEPPPGLHGEVMRRASAALAREARPDAWTRLWDSRPLRLAWASAVLLLVAANALVPAMPRTPSVQAGAPRLHEEAPLGDELGAIANLPRIDLGTLPSVGSTMPPAVRAPQPARPHGAVKESAT